MRTLPNNLTVFNATKHPLTFWAEEWLEPVNVEPDALIDACIEEQAAGSIVGMTDGKPFCVALVKTIFSGTAKGELIIEEAIEAGADVVVGSLIAAQAYPGRVVCVVPALGFERVPPDQKRMRPDKFTVFSEEEMAAAIE